MPRQRNTAVDLLKFFAVFLIINSHCDAMYPRLSFLVTGGAIGDCLFLFVSGFTLFLSSPRRFDNYYKRRLRRIYPSVGAALIFIALVSPGRRFSVLDMAGGEFIAALMIYYVLLYFVRRYAAGHIRAVVTAVVLITGVVYIFFFPYKYETGERGLYGITTLFRWIPYFLFMLGGALLGQRSNDQRDRYEPRPWRDFLLTLLCTALFYGIQYAGRVRPELAPWQILSLVPLGGIIYYMYRWCEAPVFSKLLERRNVRAVVLTVGGLCLESYLIQFSLITPAFNDIWPLNLLLITAVILVCSYLVRSLARFLAQTFSPDDYDWPAIFRLY